MVALNPSLTSSGSYSISDISSLGANSELRKKFEKECEEADLECAVCFDAPFKNPQILACHHVFCKVCVDALEKKDCPLCRRGFTAAQVVPAKGKQECINNLWKRCIREEQEDKGETSDDLEKPIRVQQLRISSSSLPGQRPAGSPSLPLESSRAPLFEPTVALQEKLKYGQMVQSIFSELTEDQSAGIPQKPTFKTTWSLDQWAKVETLREFWSSSSSSSSASMGSYLDALEKVAFGLSDIARVQCHSLHISGSPGGQNVTHVYRSGGVSMQVQQHGGMILNFDSHGHGLDRPRLTEMFDLSRNIRAGNASLDEQNMQIYVGNQEVRRSEASFIRALTRLDELLIECFSKREGRGEFAKNFIVLAKISSESTEKQHDALIRLCSYCSALLQEDNLQVLLNHYNALSQEDGGIELLGKITEYLISEDRSYKEKIQTIIASLDERAVNALKNHVVATLQDGHFVESSLQLLSLCEDHKGWCTGQACQAIESCIQKNQESMATRLIDKYLMRHRETRKTGRHYLRTLIASNISRGADSSATKLVDKYFSPATSERGMNYIRTLIANNISRGADSSATKLIDNYLLNSPATKEQGMQYIGKLIANNISRGADSSATKLIENYLLNNPATKEQGMQYIGNLIANNISRGADSSATKLIENYLLNNPATKEEGMRYIGTLVANNISRGADSSATKLIENHLLNNPATKEEGMRYIGTLVASNINRGADSSAIKLIGKYFLNSPATKEQGMQYIGTMIANNIDRGSDSSAIKLIDTYLLNNPATKEQGMKYIGALIANNINRGADSSATKLIDKYFLNNPATKEQGMRYISTLVVNNISRGADSSATKLIDNYFLINPATREEGLNYIRTLIRRNENSGHSSAAKNLARKYYL